MKKLALFIFISISWLFAEAQMERKEISFVGGSRAYYDGKVATGTESPGGKIIYKAYIVNGGDFNRGGRVILDEKNKIFSVKWDNGDDWTADFTKKEVKGKFTTYTGKWRDSFYEAQLEIEDAGEYGCGTTIKSRRVIDEEYGINTWKKFWGLRTFGKCLIKQDEEAIRITKESRIAAEKKREELRIKEEEQKRIEEEALRTKEEKEAQAREDTLQANIKVVQRLQSETGVEIMPEFRGGMNMLMDYLSKNIKYPLAAKEAGIQGRIYVAFVIRKDGTITSVVLLNTLGEGIDEEAIRVVESMPKWKPGKKDGKKIAVPYILPLKFTLQ